MILLNVPYSEKDEAKGLGAKWDSNKKKWYVNERKDYRKFDRWIDGNIVIKENILIVEGKQVCWKCDKETKVYAVGILSENIIDFSEDMGEKKESVQEETGFDLQIWPVDCDMPKQLRTQLSTKFGCKVKYSHTEKRSYFANVCSNCDCLQGNFFLHTEPSSPFGHMNESQLILHKYPLKHDLISELRLDKIISPNYYYLKRSVLNNGDIEIF